MKYYKVKFAIITIITTMTNVMRASMWYEFFYGFFLVKNHDIWEKNVRIRSEIYTKYLLSVEFQDINEGVKLRRFI